MTNLSMTDASFIYAENTTCPMSIASLQLMELPVGVTADTFASTLKDFIAARTQLVPYLTNKVEWSAGTLGHPNWVTDPDFDINNHIYTVAVPAPGRFAQVEQMVARLHETPLNRDRPLWDIAVLTGLDNGQVAYYNRAHHACLDGMAAQASTQLLMDTDPHQQDEKCPLPGTGGPRQSTADHVTALFEAMARQTIDSFVKAPARAAATARLWQRSFDPSKGFGAANALCPDTPINKTIDRGRVFAAGDLPLAGVKQISRYLQCTINDVFLAVCGGALRKYLTRREALPAAELIAGCPVSLRQAGDATANNQVTMIRVALGTDIEDPIERVLRVRASAGKAKEVLADSADLMPENITTPMLGAALRGASNAAASLRLADYSRPAMNVLISNVPGPREVLYSNGARMLSHYPVSIPTHGVGVNITVQSYVDTLYIGITAAANLAADADRLRDDMLHAYAELQKALSADVVELAGSKATQKAPEKAPASAPRIMKTTPTDRVA